MPVPTIASVTPTFGPTGGRTLLEIIGTNFNVPVIPAASGAPAPAPIPTVAVKFEKGSLSEDGTRVAVVSATRLFALAPRAAMNPADIARMVGDPGVTFADVDPDTITRDAGDWVAEGFRAGQKITVGGSTSNNATLLVDAVTPLVLTLAAAEALTTEGPVTGLTIFSRGYGAGKVDIRVQNLDALGVLIPGEEVVSADAYDYRRVQLGTEADFTRFCRTLIQEFRRQTIPNVSMSTHTEFDPDETDLLDIVGIAAVPGVALLGPSMTQNRFYSQNQRSQVASGIPGEVLIKRVPYTVDLEWTIVGVSDRKVELLNLMAAVQGFFDKNKTIEMDRDPGDLSLGRVSYEIDFTEGGDLKVASRPNQSNIRSFSGTFVVRGFDIEELPGFADEKAEERIVATDSEGVRILDTEQTGQSFLIGPSPGPGGDS